MMNFPKVKAPAMPKKKAKTGIGGAIGGLLEKVRAKGRPAMSDSVPGAPRAAADATAKRKGAFKTALGRLRDVQSTVDDPAGTSGNDAPRAKRIAPWEPIKKAKFDEREPELRRKAFTSRPRFGRKT